jgi:Sep15/SelM redox domain
LPELQSFIKDGEAEWYHNVRIKYVRGEQATLHVYNVSEADRSRQVEIDTVSLSSLRNKEAMHRAMQNYGFIMKSPQERQADIDKANRIREQKNYAMFFRQEYLRQQFYHAYFFRQDVMIDTIYYNNITWTYAENDFLLANYENIFRNEVIKKPQIREYAVNYLIRIGRIISQ